MQNWMRKWFFLGGPWEASTYRVAKVEGHVPRVLCIPRWVKVQRANDHTIKRLVDAVFALRVSLHSLDYITEVDLKTFRLAPVDDDEYTSFPSVVSAPSAMVPFGPATRIVPSPALALTRAISVPRGKLSLL